MANAIFGATFDNYVQEQIKKRQNSKNGRAVGFEKSTEKNAVVGINSQLIYAQQTAYTRLISGVDIKEDKGKAAQQYQLFGTNFGDGDTTTNKVGFTKGLADSWSSLASYGFVSDEKYGFVPPPGITSVDIKALNRGSLREANIEILCHSIDQFNIIDQLYLRLGYTVCLDWGWTTYIDNTTDLIKTSENTNNWATDVLKGSDDGYKSIQNKIQEYREKSSSNWDAMIGRVVNFSWTVERNGGFNIRLTIRSVGDVIESLKINTSHPVKSTSQEIASEDTDKQPPLEYNKNKSSLNRILWYLASLFKSDGGPAIKPQDSTSPSNIGTGTGLTPNKNYTPEPSTMDLASFAFPSLEGIEKSYGSEKTKYQYYIRLGSLLRIIQDFLLLYNTEKTEKPSLFEISYAQDRNFMFTYPRQASLDPRVCLIPIQATLKDIPDEPNQNNTTPPPDPAVSTYAYVDTIYTWNSYIDQGVIVNGNYSENENNLRGPYATQDSATQAGDRNPFSPDDLTNKRSYGYTTIGGIFENEEIYPPYLEKKDYDYDQFFDHYLIPSRLRRYREIQDNVMKENSKGRPGYFETDEGGIFTFELISPYEAPEFLSEITITKTTSNYNGGDKASVLDYTKKKSELTTEYIENSIKNNTKDLTKFLTEYLNPLYEVSGGEWTPIDLTDPNNLNKPFLIKDDIFNHTTKVTKEFQGNYKYSTFLGGYETKPAQYYYTIYTHQAIFRTYTKLENNINPTLQLPQEENIVDVNNKLYQDWVNDTNSKFRVPDYDFAGRTMEIMVNMNYVTKILESYIDTSTGAISVYDFLNKLMGGIQNALGNINRFNITYNEDANIFKIVDSTFIPGIAKICPDCATYSTTNPKFKLKNKYSLGLNKTVTISDYNEGSFVRDFSIKTKLSNNFASMITIGAQANGNVVGEDAIALSKWNEGLIDRFYHKKSSANEPEDGDDINTVYVSNVIVLQDLNNKVNDGNITSEQIDGANNPVTDLYKYELGKYSKAGDIPSIGFIPIDLELTIDGLSGIKIYEMFDVDDSYLPNVYKDSIQFIATGVSHKIQDGDWVTTINSICGPKFDPYATKKFGGKATNVKIKYGKKVKVDNNIDITPGLVTTPSPRTIGNTDKQTELMKKALDNTYANGETKNHCGSGTWNVASNLYKLKNGKSPHQGMTENSGGPSAKSQGAADKLKTIGYTEYIIGNNLTMDQVREILKNGIPNPDGTYSPWIVGDIAIYWANDGDPKDNGPTQHGHAQIYSGKNSKGKWSTDNRDNYGTSFVYGNYNRNNWNLRLLLINEVAT